MGRAVVIRRETPPTKAGAKYCQPCSLDTILNDLGVTSILLSTIQDHIVPLKASYTQFEYTSLHSNFINGYRSVVVFSHREPRRLKIAFDVKLEA